MNITGNFGQRHSLADDLSTEISQDYCQTFDTANIGQHPQTQLVDYGDVTLNCIFMESIPTVMAYTLNASLLQIPCSPVSQLRTYSPVSLSLPSQLIPTQAQRTIPHPSFVDIIPFPNFRDRILNSLHGIRLEVLAQDLVRDAFRIWGRDSWDATGWEVSEEFANTWLFLIDDELFRVTNFWRKQKLKPPLSNKTAF